MKQLLALLLGCASTAPVQPAAPVTRVITGPADTPYAVHELELPSGARLRLPATGLLRCSVYPEDAFSLNRETSWIEVEGGSHSGWSMLRILHDTGARTLYRFFQSPRLDEPCGEDCFEMQLNEQESYPVDHIRSYSEGPPNVIEVRLTPTHFVFVAVREGTTSLLLVRDDGTQTTLRFRVYNPQNRPASSRPTPTRSPAQCETDRDCPAAECAEGLCASWQSVDCSLRP